MIPTTRGTKGAEPAAQARRTLTPVLIVLTAVTGMVDAVSYLGLGHVFTANMTGNVVLLGFAFTGAGQVSIASSLLALASFLAGAACGGRLIRVLAPVHHRWVGGAFGLEIILVAGAALLALTRTDVSDHAVIALLAAAMGLRNATVRRLAVPDLTTTVLTLTLTGLAADTQLAAGEPWSAAGRRVFAVGAMLVGGAIGALLLRANLAAPLACVTAIMTLVTVAYLRIVWPRRPAAQRNSA